VPQAKLPAPSLALPRAAPPAEYHDRTPHPTPLLHASRAAAGSVHGAPACATPLPDPRRHGRSCLSRYMTAVPGAELARPHAARVQSQAELATSLAPAKPKLNPWILIAAQATMCTSLTSTSQKDRGRRQSDRNEIDRSQPLILPGSIRLVSEGYITFGMNQPTCRVQPTKSIRLPLVQLPSSDSRRGNRIGNQRGPANKSILVNLPIPSGAR
jgi:hypothetical protein